MHFKSDYNERTNTTVHIHVLSPRNNTGCNLTLLISIEIGRYLLKHTSQCITGICVIDVYVIYEHSIIISGICRVSHNRAYWLSCEATIQCPIDCNISLLHGPVIFKFMLIRQAVNNKKNPCRRIPLTTKSVYGPCVFKRTILINNPLKDSNHRIKLPFTIFGKVGHPGKIIHS